MMMSDMNLKSYSDTSYHNEELKSLTRYRFNKMKEQEKLKSSISRLVNILFPELEKLVPQLHMASVYALLSEFPSTSLFVLLKPESVKLISLYFSQQPDNQSEISFSMRFFRFTHWVYISS